MKVGIIGGKLQGIEACYLAREAGYKIVLLDSNVNAQASTLADKFLCCDINKMSKAEKKALTECDLILPACENTEVLAAARDLAIEENVPIAFDFDAYRISSSKVKSDRLFADNGILAPVYYPNGNPPYIIKPSGESGSHGVLYCESRGETDMFLKGIPDSGEWIAQEYIEGPSYSIEVIGDGREWRTFTVTKIHTDDTFDCCKVTAPCPELPERLHQKFAEIGQLLGSIVGLRGIMDVEVIEKNGQLYVLEIDARIPSQTPIAVYYASGVNLLEVLVQSTLTGELPGDCGQKINRHVTYEHYMLSRGQVIQAGEHIMNDAGPLTVVRGLFGADYVVTDYMSGCEEFRGIFINSDENLQKLEEKRAHVLRQLQKMAD